MTFGIDNYNAPGWRFNNLVEFFKDSPLHPDQTDLYQFGVFLGASLVTLYDAIATGKRSIPRFIGFDSFEGIPPETAEPIYQGAWASDKKGDLNQVFHPSRWIKFESREQVARQVHEWVTAERPNLDLRLIAGWYDEVLTPKTIEVADFLRKVEFKPAFYIDFDADIYSSTKIAYDFMARNKFIVPGTIIGFDDWGGAPNRDVLGGEARAHAEALEEWGITGTLYEFNFYDERLQQAIFVVSGIV